MPEPRALPLLLSAALIALPGFAQEAPASDPCSTIADSSIVVAMPLGTDRDRIPWGDECALVTEGSDYQRLSWLENNEVDASALSSFALSLIRF